MSRKTTNYVTMARISEELKEQVRLALPVAHAIMADGFHLRELGENEWRGDCPFHPSPDSSAKRQRKFHVRNDHFRCWQCGEQGDLFAWFQKYHGLDFVDAVREAGARVGIDVDASLPAQNVDAAARRRQGVLGSLYDHSIRAAVKRVAEGYEPQFAQLVEAGEVGWLEDYSTVTRHLAALGFADADYKAVGLSSEMPADTWLLWAFRRTSPVAARPLGRTDLVFGVDGKKTCAWVAGRNARRALVEEDALLVMDDDLYLYLRGIGREAVFLPVSQRTLAVDPSGLPRLRSSKKPPILLVRPIPERRKVALEAALALLPESPRLRATEVDPLPPNISSPEWAKRALSLACKRAGVVLDWQMTLVAQHGFLADRAGRLRAAQHLHRIAAVTPTPLEQALYLDAIHNFTGVRIEAKGSRAVSRPDRTALKHHAPRAR